MFFLYRIVHENINSIKFGRTRDSYIKHEREGKELCNT